jgi:predicted Zn-dependent protease
MNTKHIIALSAFGLALAACTTNPLTGRSSFQMANNGELAASSLQQYRQVLSSSKVIKGTAEATRVSTVGARIKAAAEAYYRSIGREEALAGYQWEFNLIESNQLNAWCMPGGKVAFYSGIMPVCATDNGVAVVMGHEVAHALAGHGNERVSSQMMAQTLGQLGGSLIKNQSMGAAFQKLYPVGAQLGMLSYGRNQELEADEMGLYLMAMAGYNPNEAPVFWQRMQANASGQRQPEFLSTHPNPENRIEQLNHFMPKALSYYKK